MRLAQARDRAAITSKAIIYSIPLSDSHLSTSSAAMQPVPAEVIALSLIHI